MKVICAWCKEEIQAQPGPEDAVSHGICDDCAKILKAEAKAIAETWVKDVKVNAGGLEKISV